MNQEAARPDRGISVSDYGVSLATAAVVVGGFFWTAREAPLPATWWAAAFLFLAVEHDVRALRIPNWLTLGGLGVALGQAVVSGGGPGLLASLAGAGIALAVLIVPFALRGIGAGDVKAMMVFGALWGVELLPALFWMVVAGGVLAICLVAIRGELWDLCVRWGRSLWITLSTRRVTYFGPDPGSAASGGIPFAVAIGVGASLYQHWGFPWG